MTSHCHLPSLISSDWFSTPSPEQNPERWATLSDGDIWCQSSAGEPSCRAPTQNERQTPAAVRTLPNGLLIATRMRGPTTILSSAIAKRDDTGSFVLLESVVRRHACLILIHGLPPSTAAPATAVMAASAVISPRPNARNRS